MYLLRDKNGVLKARFDNFLAQRMINEIDGHFCSYRAGNDNPKTVYEIDTDSKWGSTEFAVYLWKGDILIPG